MTTDTAGWITDQPTFNKAMLNLYPGWSEEELNDLWAKYQSMKTLPPSDINSLIGAAITAGLEASDKVTAITKIVSDT